MWGTTAEFCPQRRDELVHVLLILRVPAAPAAAATARHAVAGLSPFLNADVRENAELLVSELVTNSIRHANLAQHDCIEIKLDASEQAVLVEVADCGQGFQGRHPGPSARAAQLAEPDRTSGWGLFLVDQIASRWGIVEAGETRVWFELRPGATVGPEEPAPGFDATATG
jgi:anti-sigma regulatory factor (Ser/Thr protein kinase)